MPAREPVAVLVGVPVPVCHQIDTRPARGCAGCWRAYPVGRWPAWRACRVPVGGARGQGAYLVAVLWLAGLPLSRWPAWCACRVPVGGAVGRVPTWWPCWCWRAYLWGHVRAGARVPPDRRTAHPWPCRCWLAYP